MKQLGLFNKRAGPNKRAGWKIGQKQIIVHGFGAGINNRVRWKNTEKFNNCAG